MVDIARESALQAFAQLSTKASQGVYSVLDASSKINVAVFETVMKFWEMKSLFTPANARQGCAFGDSSAPDSMQPKSWSKNGRGYIVGPFGWGDASPFIKVLPNPFGNSIYVLKYFNPLDTSPWTEMDLEDIASTRQLLEVIGWLCLGLGIKVLPESAPESLVETLSRVTKVYELAVANMMANMKASAAAKRSEKAVARAAAEKAKAFREAKKATAVIAKVAASADGEVEEEEDKSSSHSESESEEDEQEVEVEVESTPKTSKSLLAQLAAKNKELAAMRQDLEVVIKHRNVHAARSALLAKRERINAKLERLEALQKRQRTDIKNDLRTVLLADDESDEDDDATDIEEDEEMEEKEEERVFEASSSNKRSRVV